MSALQIDLGWSRDVVGVGMQGGFYEDVGETLVYRTEAWVTYFMASYSTDGSTYLWATGSAQVDNNLIIIIFLYASP